MVPVPSALLSPSCWAPAGSRVGGVKTVLQNEPRRSLGDLNQSQPVTSLPQGKPLPATSPASPVTARFELRSGPSKPKLHSEALEAGVL